ncbi:uncharacterized protein LOC122027109 [Zingiber officinale]|uniref:F-box domain-containing protein n=1 Tax=Zingiber officinale TaxID=94328 RepID=A0A8J5CFQ1_ZINOF|nr:uncharacterized protein LOC122027109 [Zingiber officinale]XP_042441891.1 uncharacterized protein LOC122027109 [Zingiber officinale]XP_042441892.1 uncharacterized protein LOC122027109 [Zingiber officinale]XP_042441893.1 uncharacterized protein LOC122027109 [Zingiber officinale]KAG6473511.1 hypothetical protein ZIOFF_067428 [Zingiber officinale]
MENRRRATGNKRRRRRRSPAPPLPASDERRSGLRDSLLRSSLDRTNRNQRHRPPASDRTNLAASQFLAAEDLWSDLPDLLLLSVLDRLPSVRDLFLVASVCRSWRSVFRSYFPSASYGRPPLLILPCVEPEAYQWIEPPRCLLRSPSGPFSSGRSMVPSETLCMTLLGSSYGQLIFRNRVGAVVADAFTGEELRPPTLPEPHRFYFGALTGPLSSPGSHLLLCDKQSLFLWQVGSSSWKECSFEQHHFFIIGVMAFKDNIFVLSSSETLYSLQFSPSFGVKELTVPWCGESSSWAVAFGSCSRMVECDGKLMLIRFVPFGEETDLCFAVYSLDFSGQPTWSKVDNLGDWALFVDIKSNFSISCAHPGRWGGRSNCIYNVDRLFDHWHEFPLDAPTRDIAEVEHPFDFTSLSLLKWPSPIWVYPSMLY